MDLAYRSCRDSIALGHLLQLLKVNCSEGSQCEVGVLELCLAADDMAVYVAHDRALFSLLL